MFDEVPIRVWLVLAIAVAAYAPARYVYDYVAYSPRRRDITRPGEDLSWRTSGRLARSVGGLGILVGLAIFIFTPAATRLAQSPRFFPMIVSGIGLWSLWTVVRGYQSGTIEPMVRGANWCFGREAQPKRYWASIGWNALFGSLCLFLGYTGTKAAPEQAIRDRCHDWNERRAASEIVSACNRLLAIGDLDDSDKASVMSARGSGYYKMADYRRAGADYANAVRLAPDESSFRYNLGLVHDQLGDATSAFEDYNTAIHLDAENGDAYVQRGMILLNENKLDLAIADFTRAHAIDPKNVVPLANRGLTYAWKNDRRRAMHDFETVRATDPFNIVAYHGEGLLAVNEIDPERAIPPLTAAILRDPSDAWALSMRAQAYGQLGDKINARADQDAIRLLADRKPDSTET